MALLALLMIFIAPIYQLKLISKKTKGKISISLFYITMLMVGLQIAVTLIAIILYNFTNELQSKVIKCDMTTPVIMMLGALIALFVIPLVGILKGLPNGSQNKIDNTIKEL